MESDPAPSARQSGEGEPLGEPPSSNGDEASEQAYGPLELHRLRKDDGRHLIAYRRRPTRG